MPDQTESFGADTEMTRAACRVDHLLKASARLAERLEDPEVPEARKVKLRARLAEYVQSLENFKNYGQEIPPSDRLEGVNVEVPTHIYELVGRAPGGVE